MLRHSSSNGETERAGSIGGCNPCPLCRTTCRPTARVVVRREPE
jgi:hypothetical protein